MSGKPPEKVTLIHTADLHLGRPFEALGKKAEERREDLRATFRELVERALVERVDLFLVAGDLFDSPCPPPADREVAAAGFRRLREAGVRGFAIPGNHDFFIPGGVWSELAAAGAVVFCRPVLEGVEVPELDLQVYGMAYDRERPQVRPLENLRLEVAGRSLLLFHGSLDVIGEGTDEAPFSEAEIARLAFGYVALGHYHGHRQIGAKPLAAYPGSPEGLGMGPREAGERCFLLGRLETSGGETRVHLGRMSVGRRRVLIRDVDLSRCACPEDLFEAVRSAASSDDLLAVRLVGVPTPEVWDAALELEERFSGGFFHFRVEHKGVALPERVPDDDRFILGRFYRKLRAKIAEAEGEERTVLETALRLGLAAAARPKSAPRSGTRSLS